MTSGTTPASDKPHLSNTQLAMLERCGVQYQFRYLEGQIAPPGVSLLTGRGTHGAVEADLGEKIRTGELLPDEAVAAAARDATLEAWDTSAPHLTPDEVERGIAAVRGESVDQAVALAGLHHAELAPKLQPTAVEQRWRAVLPGFPYDIVGVIDVIEGDGDVVRDTKTAAKSPARSTADLSEQLTMYALGVRALRGRLPERLTLDHLVKPGKRTGPRLVVQETARTDEDLAMQLRRVEAAAGVIEAGAFMPADPASWQCSERFCGYWSRCPYAKRPVSVAVPAGGQASSTE